MSELSLPSVQLRLITHSNLEICWHPQFFRTNYYVILSSVSKRKKYLTLLWILLFLLVNWQIEAFKGPENLHWQETHKMVSFIYIFLTINITTIFSYYVSLLLDVRVYSSDMYSQGRSSLPKWVGLSKTFACQKGTPQLQEGHQHMGRQWGLALIHPPYPYWRCYAPAYSNLMPSHLKTISLLDTYP